MPLGRFLTFSLRLGPNTGRERYGKGDPIVRPLLASVGWARIRADEEQRWLAKIHHWAAERDDCLWLDRVETYRFCRVAGVVTRLRIDPRAGAMEVTISDGTASLAAQWPIRPPAGLLRAVPRSGLILEGIPRVGPRGELLMVEPAFEIVPGPDEQ